MKTPIYVTLEQKKKFFKLYKQFIKKEGIKNALLFKKITMVGMYGCMLSGKIDLDTFYTYLERNVCSSKTIENFMNLYERAKYGDEIFCVPAKIITEGTYNELENAIINLFTNKLKPFKSLYVITIKKMFNNSPNI